MTFSATIGGPSSPVTVTVPGPCPTPPPLNWTSQSPFVSATAGKTPPGVNLTLTCSPGRALPFKKLRAPYSAFVWNTMLSPNQRGTCTAALVLFGAADTQTTRATSALLNTHILFEWCWYLAITYRSTAPAVRRGHAAGARSALRRSRSPWTRPSAIARAPAVCMRAPRTRSLLVVGARHIRARYDTDVRPLVLRWRRLDPRTRQVVFILLGRFRHLYESPCSRTNSYDSRFGCGSYRFDGDGCVCMCLHTTHNAAAAPCPACFQPVSVLPVILPALRQRSVSRPLPFRRLLPRQPPSPPRRSGQPRQRALPLWARRRPLNTARL
eukprot:COSAG02_NODE_13700_length_1359_cov_2.944444_2_plen_325_part_00